MADASTRAAPTATVAPGDPQHVSGTLVHLLLDLLERRAVAAAAEGPPGRASLLTPWGVAEWLNVPVEHVTRLIDQYGLPVLLVGPAWRFRPADVDAWIQRRVVTLEPHRERTAARPRAVAGPRLRRVQ